MFKKIFIKSVDDVVFVFTKAIADLEKVKEFASKEKAALDSKIASLEADWKSHHEEHVRADKIIANLKKVFEL